MTRELTPDERALVTAMIRQAPANADAVVTSEDRARWMQQVPYLLVTGGCDCGCPTIYFTDNDTPDNRVWLSAWDDAQQAMLILFLDDGKVSQLEIAPTDDRHIDLPALANVDYS
ncbi:MAG: hypothetical protein PUK40_05120 [Actinomycetaceae bacterium]|nr:hypothetical protein [Arcanobacterium sp.]MDD7505311.1 hypothetical protein [Actinomycetaceae bacterium]MDY6143537.1 hypothetical protein [Arcanobacterium sp.]